MNEGMRKFWKRFFGCLLVLAVIGLLAGCGGDDQNSQTSMTVFTKDFGSPPSQKIVFTLPGTVDDPITYGLTVDEARLLKATRLAQIKMLRVQLAGLNWPGFYVDFKTGLQPCRVELSGVPAGEYRLTCWFIDGDGWDVANTFFRGDYLISVSSEGVNDLGELDLCFSPFQKVDFDVALPSGLPNGLYGFNLNTDYAGSGGGFVYVSDGHIRTPLSMPLIRGLVDEVELTQYDDKMVPIQTITATRVYFDIMVGLKEIFYINLNDYALTYAP